MPEKTDTDVSLEQELQQAIEDTKQPAAEPPADQPSPEPEPNATVPDLVKQRLESQAEPEPGPEAKAKRDLLETLSKKYGEDLSSKYTNDEELLRGLVNAHHLVGKRDEDAAMWRAFAANPEGFLQQWGYQKAQQQQQDAAPQQPGPSPDAPPEFDPAWYQMVERSPVDGSVTGVKPGVDPTIAIKLRKAEQWAANRERELLFNPEKVLEPLIEKKLKEIDDTIEERIKENLQGFATRQQAVDWLNAPENRKWIFVDGQPNRGLSQQGMKFYQYVNQAVQSKAVSEYDLPGLVRYATDQMELEWRRSKDKGNTGPAQKATPTAMHAPNVADQGEEGVTIQENESLEDAMRRIVGLPRR